MKLLEYEAKDLLQQSHLAIPRSFLVSNQVPDFSPPLVLKSQVPTGGRGKAGGIIVVESQNQLSSAVSTLLSLPIKGFLPKMILAEEKLSIAREFYLSLIIDRSLSNLQLIAHANGGVEVEENTDFKKWSIEYGELNPDILGQELADYFDLPDQTFALQDLVENLYECFVKNDATLIEINPLILTTENKLIAGDCKMTLDDSAAFRHDWKFEEEAVEANFVTINQNGNVATIANGAGLAMATVDAAFDSGLSPANFLDIGGGANTETLLKAFRRIVDYPHIQAIIINIFAGITRSDEVARAIVAAKQQIDNLPPLFIRLAGTNYQEAADILSAEEIVMFPNLESSLQAAKEVIHE